MFIKSDDDSETWVDIWEVSGNQGNTWHKALAEIPADVSEIRFAGETGSGYRSDIGIDSIL